MEKGFSLRISSYLGHAVAQLVEALSYKSEGRGVRFPMVSLEFFIDIFLQFNIYGSLHRSITQYK